MIVLFAFCQREDILWPREAHRQLLPRLRRMRIELVDQSRAWTDYRCRKADLPRLINTLFSLAVHFNRPGVVPACQRGAVRVACTLDDIKIFGG